MDAWNGLAENRGFLWGAIGLGLAGLATGYLVHPLAGAAVLFAAAALAVCESVLVTVDASGLTAAGAHGRFGRVHIPLEDIEQVMAIELRPARWGGWGYRGSLRLFKRAAWVVRTGEAIELTLVGGRRFAVTVDNAAGGVAALEARLSRRG